MMAGVFEGGTFVSDAEIARRTRRHAVWLWGVVLIAVVGSLALMVFRQQGVAWFVVESPSMGQVAPVGTLVVTEPTAMSDIRAGDVITFHPPTEPKSTYTHRVVSNTDGVILTQGDINGALDPWQVTESDILGKVTAIVIGLGWIVRALPTIVVGVLAVLLIAQSILSCQRRAATRIIGFSFVAAIAAIIYRPFAGVVVLGTELGTDKAHSSVVSTGLLPVRVQAAGGTHVDLVAGQVGQLNFPLLTSGGDYRLTMALHLSPTEWAVTFGVCLLPLLWVVIVGIPKADTQGIA